MVGQETDDKVHKPHHLHDLFTDFFAQISNVPLLACKYEST